MTVVAIATDENIRIDRVAVQYADCSEIVNCPPTSAGLHSAPKHDHYFFFLGGGQNLDRLQRLAVYFLTKTQGLIQKSVCYAHAICLGLHRLQQIFQVSTTSL